MHRAALVLLGVLLPAPGWAADAPWQGARAERMRAPVPVVRRVVRVESCGSCAGYRLPWGGLRKTYVDALPWGGLRHGCRPARRTRAVVLVRKG